MAKNKGNFEKLKTTLLPIVSGVAFIVLLWLLLYGKVKVGNLLEPIIQKLPKDEAGLVQSTENVLGTAVEKIRGGEAKKWAERGSEVFEESDYTEPARDLRDDVKDKLDQSINDAKKLPAQEVRMIQRQVCQEWFGEEIFIATESAE